MYEGWRYTYYTYVQSNPLCCPCAVAWACCLMGCCICCNTCTAPDTKNWHGIGRGISGIPSQDGLEDTSPLSAEKVGCGTHGVELSAEHSTEEDKPFSV